MQALSRASILLALSVVAVAQQPSELATAKPPIGSGLRNRVDRLFRDGALPERLEVDGAVVLTKDLDSRCEAMAADPALQRAQFVILDLLREELRRTGKVLADEALDAAYETYRKPYDDTPFTVKVIATKFKGYPGLEAFVERWRVQHAFEQTLTIGKEQLQQEAERWQQFFGDGTVAVDLWYFAADRAGGADWNFPEAEKQANAAATALRAGADPEAVRKTSDPITAVAGWPGRPLGYNMLRQMMRESEYSDLGVADSAARAVFFDGKPGDLLGPLRSVRGYWLARVQERHAAKRKFELKSEREEQLVREVLVQRLFLEWADAVVGRAVVRVPGTSVGK